MLVAGATYHVVNGTFDAVVVRGRDRITAEAVDPAGNAGEGEAVVRREATWPEVGLAVAMAGAWAWLGWRERWWGWGRISQYTTAQSIKRPDILSIIFQKDT